MNFVMNNEVGPGQGSQFVYQSLQMFVHYWHGIEQVGTTEDRVQQLSIALPPLTYNTLKIIIMK